MKQKKCAYALIAIVFLFIIISIIFFTQVIRKTEQNIQQNIKPLFEKYLSERYSEKMVALDVHYDSIMDEYNCYTYLSTDENINFYTFAKKNGDSYLFRDNYFLVLWEQEADSDIKQYILGINNNVYSVDFSIYGDEITVGNSTEYKFQFNEYTPKTKVPTYQDIKNSIYIRGLRKELEIEINGELTDKNKDKECEDILKILQYIRTYNVDYLTIKYGTFDNGAFTSDSNNIIEFGKEEIDNINTVEGIQFP